MTNLNTDSIIAWIDTMCNYIRFILAYIYSMPQAVEICDNERQETTNFYRLV